MHDQARLEHGHVHGHRSSAQATLSRHGAVYAAGTARVARGRISLRLLPVRRHRGGRYTLTLVAGSGAHGGIRSESFTLIGARRRHLTREP